MDDTRLNAFLVALDKTRGDNEFHVAYRDLEAGFDYFATVSDSANYGSFGSGNPNMLFHFNSIPDSLVNERNHIDLYLNDNYNGGGWDYYPAHTGSYGQPYPDPQEDGDPYTCDVEYSDNAIQTGGGYSAVRLGSGCCTSYVPDSTWYLGGRGSNVFANHEAQHLFHAARGLWGAEDWGFPNEMFSKGNEYLQGVAHGQGRPVYNNVYDWPLIPQNPTPGNYTGLAFSHWYLWMAYLAQQFPGDTTNIEDGLVYKYAHYRDGSGNFDNTMYGLARVLDDARYSSLGGGGAGAGDVRLRNLFHDYSLAKWINNPSPAFYGGRLGFSRGLVPSQEPGFFDNSFNPCARASAVEVPPRFSVGPERIASDSTYAIGALWSATDTGQGGNCDQSSVSHDSVGVYQYSSDYIQLDANAELAGDGKANTLRFRMFWNTSDYPGLRGGSLRMSAISYAVGGDSLYAKGAYVTHITDAFIDSLRGFAEVWVRDFGSATRSVVIEIDLGEQAPETGAPLGLRLRYGYSFAVDTTNVIATNPIDLDAFRDISQFDFLYWTDPSGCGSNGYYIQQSRQTPWNLMTVDSVGAGVQDWRNNYGFFADTLTYYRVLARGGSGCRSNLATIGGRVRQSHSFGDSISKVLRVSGDVTVPAGYTWTIRPGSTIRVDYGDGQFGGLDPYRTEVYVNGGLSSVGTISDTIRWTPSEPPVSPGSWRGIRVVGPNASATRFDYSQIEGAYHGLQMRACSTFVEHSRIQNNTFYGIYVDAQGQGTKPTINNCILEQNHGAEIAVTTGGLAIVRHCHLHYPSNGTGSVDDGIVFSLGNGDVQYNRIDGVGLGVYCATSSSPSLTGSSDYPYGRNDILNFRYDGILTYDNSDPLLGYGSSDTGPLAGRNNVFSANYPSAVWVDHAGPNKMSAEYCYWGNASPDDPAKFRTPGPNVKIDADPAISAFEQPGGPQWYYQGYGTAAPLHFDSTATAEQQLAVGLLMEGGGSYDDATSAYRSIVTNTPDDPTALVALDRLLSLAYARGRGGTEVNYAGSFATATVPDRLKEIAARYRPRLLIQAGAVQDGLRAYDGLLKAATGDVAGLLFEIAVQKGLVLADTLGARSAALDLTKSTRDRFLLKHARAMLQEVVGEAAWAGVRGLIDGSETAPDEVLGTSLEQNFPNPMNPSTTFSFSLAAPGRVILRVFDVQGRLVRTIADGYYGGGRHAVRWDGADSHGRQIASGMYYYRLEAPGRSLSRKLLVLK